MAAGTEIELQRVSGGSMWKFRPARLFRASTLAFALTAFVAGALLTAGVGVRRAASEADRDTVVREVWGPLGRAGAQVVLCVGTPSHPHSSDGAPASLRLGEVRGLVSAARTLDRLGAQFQIVAEDRLTLGALRKRNAIFIGNPEQSASAQALLQDAPLTVAYDVTRGEAVVRSAVGTDRLYVPERTTGPAASEAFGLLTVRAGEHSGLSEAAAPRTVVVSCTHSAGCDGAMDFFASASSLRDLRQRFKAAAHDTFPRAYQVVVRTRVEHAQAVHARYESHVVWQ